jgi:hypothetical protein
MTTPRLGLLIGATGMTSMSVLASDAEGRVASLRLYADIQDLVENFERDLRVRLGRKGREQPPNDPALALSGQRPRGR